MLTMDEQEVDLYQLGKPILTVNPTSESTLNKTYQFTINAHSVNQFSGRSMICTFTLKYTVTSATAMTMW